jgi:hypothetical protein
MEELEYGENTDRRFFKKKEDGRIAVRRKFWSNLSCVD